MTSHRRKTSNGLLTVFVIGWVPMRRRLRTALLLRSRRLVLLAFVWRVMRRIMVGRPEPIRVVTTRSAVVESE
jgi:hypothetical protein